MKASNGVARNKGEGASSRQRHREISQGVWRHRGNIIASTIRRISRTTPHTPAIATPAAHAHTAHSPAHTYHHPTSTHLPHTAHLTHCLRTLHSTTRHTHHRSHCYLHTPHTTHTFHTHPHLPCTLPHLPYHYPAPITSWYPQSVRGMASRHRHQASALAVSGAASSNRRK